MLLTELNDVIGEQINIVKGSVNLPKENQDKVIVAAMTISSLAKQSINLADVMLRAEKLENEGKLYNAEILSLIK